MDRSNKRINKVMSILFLEFVLHISIPDCKVPAAGCRMEGAAEEPGNNLKMFVNQ